MRAALSLSLRCLLCCCLLLAGCGQDPAGDLLDRDALQRSLRSLASLAAETSLLARQLREDAVPEVFARMHLRALREQMEEARRPLAGMPFQLDAAQVGQGRRLQEGVQQQLDRLADALGDMRKLGTLPAIAADCAALRRDLKSLEQAL